MIDREAFLNPILEFLLVAEDVGKLNSTARLTVTILDDNDNRPAFNPAVLIIHLLENSPPGQKEDKYRDALGNEVKTLLGIFSKQ